MSEMYTQGFIRIYNHKKTVLYKKYKDKEVSEKGNRFITALEIHNINIGFLPVKVSKENSLTAASTEANGTT